MMIIIIALNMINEKQIAVSKRDIYKDTIYTREYFHGFEDVAIDFARRIVRCIGMIEIRNVLKDNSQ